MGRRSDIDGRELLLEAALRLFATDGIDAVSIRAVNREAGLGPASVHYHFGTKEALVDAVLHVYGDVVIDAVQERAREISASQEAVDARDLVVMLAKPYLDLMATHTQAGSLWVRLVGQLLQSDPTRILDRPSSKLTWKAAAHVYPQATPASVERAMRMCFTLLVTQLAQLERGGGRTFDLDLLIDFLSAGLDAALRPETARSTGPISA